MEGDGEYQIKFPIMGWGEKEIAIEIHRDAGQILTKAGNRAPIGICRFMRKRKLDLFEVGGFRQGVEISWVSKKSPMVTTSKEAGAIQEVSYGFDMALMLKGLFSELFFGNIGVEIPTYAKTIIRGYYIKWNQRKPYLMKKG